MFTHAIPARPQRCHWYVKVGAGAALHVPLWAAKVWVLIGVPVIDGAMLLSGNTPGRVGNESALPGPLPSALVAWTLHVYSFPLVRFLIRMGDEAPLN